MTVNITDATSTTSMGGTLTPSQIVDLYGRCTAASAMAVEQVVIIDDQRTP